MSEAFPELTLFLGPQTSLGRSINDIMRVSRGAFPDAGLRVYPNRISMPIIGQCQDATRSVAERQEVIKAAAAGLPMLLSATSFFGGGREMFSGLRLLPGAGDRFRSLQGVAPQARIVLSVDPVHHLFLAQQAGALDTRVVSAGWEQVFELSWVEAVQDIRDVLPEAEILILTANAARCSETVMADLLGPGAGALPDLLGLFRPALDETGRAILARLEAEGPIDQKRQEELLDSFKRELEYIVFKEKYGFDKVTDLLLKQKFSEDVAQIEKIPNVRVF